MLSMHGCDIALKNAQHEQLIRDSDAWLAGERVAIELPETSRETFKPLAFVPCAKKLSAKQQRQQDAAEQNRIHHANRLKQFCQMAENGATVDELAAFMRIQPTSVYVLLKRCNAMGLSAVSKAKNRQDILREKVLKRIADIVPSCQILRGLGLAAVIDRYYQGREARA